jgi:hypothetical protein
MRIGDWRGVSMIRTIARRRIPRGLAHHSGIALLTILVVAGLPWLAVAQTPDLLLFNADFEPGSEGENTPGSPPATFPPGPPSNDSVSLRPSEFSGIVVDCLSEGCPNQHLHIPSRSDPGLTLFQAFPDPEFDDELGSGVIRFTWRSAATGCSSRASAAAVDSEDFRFFELQYRCIVLPPEFIVGRLFVVRGGPEGPESVDTGINYASNVFQSFRAVVDLDARTFDFFVGETQVVSGAPFADGSGPGGVGTDVSRFIAGFRSTEGPVAAEALLLDDVRIVKPTAVDTDADGHVDAVDNCPLTYNPDQADRDADGVGDVCDNCQETFNPDQENDDDPEDGVGDACEADHEEDLVGPTGSAQPGTSLVVEAIFRTTQTLVVPAPDCFNTAFSVKLLVGGVPVGDFLPPTYNERTSYGPEDVITIPPGEFRVRCDLFGATGTAYHGLVLTSGPGGAPQDYQVRATFSNNIPQLGGMTLSLVTATSDPIIVTVAGTPVTDKQEGTVFFVPPLWLAAWGSNLPALPIVAAISHVPGHHVREIDPSTIRLNGTVPIVPRSALILKDVLFVAFRARDAVQSLGTIVRGTTTTFPTVTGRFRTTATEMFTGQGKVFVFKLH